MTGTGGEPIAEAEISILSVPVSATSDSGGRFLLRGLPAGAYVVRIRRIGYKAAQFAAVLKEGESKEVEIVLEGGAYELPEVTVTARQLKPIEYAWTTRYDDFFRRRAVGLGHYLTRDQIERKGAARTPSLLAGVRGVTLRFRHPGLSGTDVRVTGCLRVSVWIDGQKQGYPDIPASRRRDPPWPWISRPDTTAMITGSYLERVLPMQVELIEIYRGPAEMPAEFLDDSCAAIAVWTR